MVGRVFITRAIPEPGRHLVAAAASEVDAHEADSGLPGSELAMRAAAADVTLCMLTDSINASVMETAAAGRCRMFANMAVGYNNLDVAAATRLGILVSNTPGVLTEATADLTWALILGAARRVAEGDQVMRQGRFLGWGPLYMLGGDVSGRILGLIGPGRIAAAVARRAAGFGMTVLYYGRGPAPELDALGARPVGFDQLLTTSDFVSVHVPLTPETRYLIDDAALGKMKPTAYLINTARGPIVHEAALVDALRNGRIAGAGLDVYEDEPLMASGLAECPNTVLLPHLGSATIATRAAMASMAAANVNAFLQGRRPPNLVNPEVWERFAPRV